MISLLVVMVLSTFTTTAQIATYNFNAPCTNTTCADNCHGLGTANVTTINNTILASASNFNLGPGLGSSSLVCGVSAMNGFAEGAPANPSRARWANNWAGVSVNVNADYFVFTLTANLSTDVQITAITWQEQRSSTGPTERQVRTSVNGFTTPISVPTNTGTGWNNVVLNTGLPLFGGSIQIRIYGYSASNTGGTLRIDNLRIYANIDNLPIELISFEASAEKDKVRLDWVTASERDNDYFTVLRSSDPTSTLADSWEEVARVHSLGNSQSTVTYTEFDFEPLNGTSYYKLRQTDLDGSSTDSHVVPVNFTRTQSRILKVGDLAFIEGQTSYLLDQLGRIVAFERTHLLEQPGNYFLQGEDRQVVRLQVLP